MYITDKFAFVEVPKTGSTYVDQIMIDMLDGAKSGKHDYPSKALLESGRSFVGSIRNPFDWYVSLWAYGCKVKERSGPYRKTTSYRPFQLNGYGFDKSLIFGGKAYAHYLIRAPFADRNAWKAAYSNSEVPENFRAWIDLMFRSREIYLYNAIFAQTRLSNFVGLYTFRYLWLCCRNREELLTRNCPNSFDELKDWEQRNCYVARFIKMENMSDDLIQLFEDFGYDLSKEQRDRIEDNKRHNASKRGRDLIQYYSPEDQSIIYMREKLIFDKFYYATL